ncbi:MAG: GIY-YIG nuclease family protein [Fulvivirga sp.]
MFVYIIYSKTSSRYYVGQTANITDRIERHNQGMVKSTKFGVPWIIVWQLEVSSRSEAMILEKKIKKRGARRFVDDYNRGVA